MMIFKFLFKNTFILLLVSIILCILCIFFSPLLLSDEVIIPFAVHPFNICSRFPGFWNNLKNIFIFSSFISLFIILNMFYTIFEVIIINFTKVLFFNSPKTSKISSTNKSSISLYLGKNSKNNSIFIPINGLYQNALITGSIGSGKTSSLLYPLTEQLLSLNFSNSYKCAFLILDVKGNYHHFVKKVCEKNFHLNDLIVIGLKNNITYNPLDKPDLKPHVLANRLKNILLLFSPQQSESYWLDKSEQVLTEAIKLCRLYNNNYVTFTELHKLIMSKDYYQEKIELLKNKFFNNSLNEKDISLLLSILNFFENEFFSLDERTQSILKSEISRITNIFISDPDVSRIFCPEKDAISFPGFKYILSNHKIVVLNMNISEYSNLSKIIAAYLKLDFQSEILMQLSQNSVIYPSCFICDEYHEYVTQNDAAFFAQSRESKSINIVATQSYSSILSSLNNPTTTKVLIQNLVNKFWFRTDDSFTIEEIIKQTGKEEKKLFSKNISENARQTSYNFMFNSFISKDSNISESLNTSFQKDFIYDSNFFSRELNTFSCLAFISNGLSILPLEKLNLNPYFKNERT